MTNGRLPDLIGLGARRCGTSWLHRCLNEHPRIGKTKDGLHFFSDHFDRGPEWYLDQLAPYADSPVVLDLSVSYSYPHQCDQVAARIAAAAPDVKLFIAVRDPVERAFSDYRRSISRLEIDKTLSFEEALERHPVFIERGLYARIIDAYLAHFPPDRLLVLFFEDLERDPAAYMRPLFEFMGVEADLDLPALGRKGESAKAIRSETYQRVLFGAKDRAQRLASGLGLEDPWEKVKERFMWMYQKAIAANAVESDIPARVRRKVVRRFEQDLKRLAIITGRNLDHYLAPDKGRG